MSSRAARKAARRMQQRQPFPKTLDERRREAEFSAFCPVHGLQP